MNYSPLYNFLLVVIVLQAVASSFSALYIFRLRSRFGRYLALAFAGVAIEAITAVITAGVSQRPAIVPWAIAARIVARLVETVTMILLSLFILGYVNGDHSVVKKNDPK